MLEKVSKDFKGLHSNAFGFTGHQLIDYPEQTYTEVTQSQLCSGYPTTTLQVVMFKPALNKCSNEKSCPHWLPPECSYFREQCNCRWSQTVSVIMPVTLLNQYVNNWFSMHASVQWAPALFMRQTIEAQVPRVFFFPPVKSLIHVVPEKQRDFLCRCGAYRIPFLWSKAGIMEVGCSDMRATTKCSTSCRFSSCREVKGEVRKKYLFLNRI